MLRRLLPPTAALSLLFAGCTPPEGPIDLSRYPAPVRVACLGDSITYGSGIPDREKNSYPAQLGALLGPRWDVRNFGHSAATLLESGDVPYRKAPEYRAARAFQPDVVIIMLGTNDSKPYNWAHRNRFAGDYAALVRKLAGLPSHPRIWLCRPMPAWPPSGYDISPEVIEKEIVPLVTAVARNEHTGLIDEFAALSGHHDFAPDHVHPDAAGARLLAREAYRALTGQNGSAILDRGIQGR
ncbi:MAG: GDSL-type esterase/lipase family protein [Opitutales bacterium]